MENVRLQQLIATQSEWEDKNPVLLSGEVGTEIYTVDNKIYQRSKTGNGTTPWNDLEYNDQDLYPYIDNTTASVGGASAGSNFYNKPLTEVLNKILNPYISPSISSLKLNNLASQTKEVGSAFASGESASLVWNLNTSANVVDDASGTVWSSENVANEFGISSDKGNLNIRSGSPYAFTFNANYTKTSPGTLYFYIQGFNSQGSLMNIASTSVSWIGRAYFGSLSQAYLTNESDIKGLVDSVLSNGNRDYNFSGGGYSFVALPSFLNVTAAVYEQIDPNTGAVIAAYSMNLQELWDSNAPASIALNNGNINMTYKVLRSEFEYGGPTICRIKLITN